MSDVWRCDITGNPVGTDTVMIGHPCQCQGCRSAAEIERLRALLDAARICFKNRDQSEREAAVYTEICRALQGYVAVPRLAAAGPPYGGQR